MNEDIPGDLTSSSMQNKRRKLQPIMGGNLNDKKSFPLATLRLIMYSSVFNVTRDGVRIQFYFEISFDLNQNRKLTLPWPNILAQIKHLCVFLSE